MEEVKTRRKKPEFRKKPKHFHSCYLNPIDHSRLLLVVRKCLKIIHKEAHFTVKKLTIAHNLHYKSTISLQF